MQTKLLVLPICVLAASCAMDGGVPVVDDAGFTHYTRSMANDHRGTISFPSQREATGKKVFIFDPKASAWAVYDQEGNRVRTGAASGGMDYCDDTGRGCRTVTGTYRILSKKGPDCRSSLYPLETHGGARMPYCMHFSGAYSIHAAYEVPNHSSSHGCVRVLPDAARWLNEEFLELGSTVIIKPYS